jgi:hypothetical protein
MQNNVQNMQNNMQIIYAKYAHILFRIQSMQNNMQNMQKNMEQICRICKKICETDFRYTKY